MGFRAGSVMLGWVHAGWVRAEFMDSVLAVTLNPWIGQLRGETAGSLIGKARNQLAARFLASGCEWLWMADTDVVFSAGALAGLEDAADPEARPVVTGIVHILRPDGTRAPSLFHVVDDRFDGPRFALVTVWGPGAVFRVDACGAACLLIHRTVLEKTGPGWFDPIPIAGRGLVGDDLSFCLRLRDAGIPVHAATGVQCGHIKPIMIGAVAP